MTPIPIPEWFEKWATAESLKVGAQLEYGMHEKGPKLFQDAAIAAYRLLSDQGIRWVKLRNGSEMPEIDEFVLWHREDGNFFVSEIDKDDYDWWNGRQGKNPLKDGYDARIEGTRCTHWARIPEPESPAPIQ